jgi:ABC-type dipeptide/oligopeptide/nickel transport system permease component
MRAYLVRRLWHGVVVVFGLSILVFLILHLTGDPAAVILPPYATREEIVAFRERMGFNDPLPAQYVRFLTRALRGDFGKSFHQGEPALALILERLPATAELSLAAIVFSLLLAVPAGILSALNRDRPLDYLCMTGALLGQSMPVFWLGLMLITFVSVQLDLFPVSGRGSFRHLVLPAITLGSYTAARIARLARSEMLEVMGQDFIRTARAKGIRERGVVAKHAVKNAMVPVVTIVALELGTVLGGAVITETIFSWPGVGRLMVQSIYDRDFPVVQAGVFVIAVVFVVLNVLVDLFYAYVDPRIRYTEA